MTESVSWIDCISDSTHFHSIDGMQEYLIHFANLTLLFTWKGLFLGHFSSSIDIYIIISYLLFLHIFYIAFALLENML